MLTDMTYKIVPGSHRIRYAPENREWVAQASIWFFDERHVSVLRSVAEPITAGWLRLFDSKEAADEFAVAYARRWLATRC